MPRTYASRTLSLALAVVLVHTAPSDAIELTLQTRDAKTGQIAVRKLELDPRKTAVIIVDPWNYHWCMTWSEQAGGTAPRMNKVLREARRLGMQVLWAPTDVASMYSGVPQRERALAFRYVPVPKARTIDLPFTLPRGAGHCGPGIACAPNYGHDGMPPDIDLDARDLIVAGTQEVYSICKHLGITHLIYLGGAVNLCLTGKPEGLVPMSEAGLECLVARDLVEAWTRYDPRSKYTPESGNAASVVDLERAGIATLHFGDELRRLKLWDDAWITEPVRLTPAGTPQRPYFFEKDVTVSLATPWLAGADIRYTLDKSAPTSASPLYRQPLVLTETTTLRAVAFREGKAVSLEGSGLWVRLPPMPPAPDVDLDQVKPVADLYGAVNGETFACLWHPRLNESYEGKPMRIRGQQYKKGLGMKAPAYARYELKPEWKRFVALAGVADNMLDINLGRNIARYPSVVFNVFVDGKPAAESPVMRISQAPWRFDVPLPPGSRILSLAVTDAGDRSPYDLANWVAAGFCVEDGKISNLDPGDMAPRADGKPRTVSPEGKEYLQRLLKRTPFGTNDFDLKALRAGMGSRREPTIQGVKLVRVKVGDIPCEWVLAPGADPDVRLLYLHGGGFVSGSGGFYLTLAAHISAAAKCAVLLPDYRLAPEHPFPAGIEDCVRAHEWLIAHGPTGAAPAKTTFIAGDSAGGNLTLATLLALRDRRLTLPVCGIPISPVTDLTLASQSLKTVHDPIISAKTMPVFRDHYLGKADPKDPLASPVFGDYRGIPPLLIQAGEHEMLRDDAVRVAKKARADGIAVKLEVWPGMFHVFQSHEPLLPEAREAIEHMAEFMRAAAGRAR